MLDALVDACVKRRVFVLALTAVLIAIGVHAYQTTPIEAFPDVTNLQVNVVTEMDGMAPPEIERQVTNGGGGMPAFSGKLTAQQITAVSEFVAANDGSQQAPE